MTKIKKCIFTVVLTLCCVFVSMGTVFTHAGENVDKFAEHFFPSGKVENIPANIYIQEKPENSYGSEKVLWLQNTQEFIDLFLEYEDYKSKGLEQDFKDKYNLEYAFDTYVIADIKVDDGEWLSDMTVLNGIDYEDADDKHRVRPYYAIFSTSGHRIDGNNMYNCTLIDCNGHDQEEPEKDGILSGTIIENKGDYNKILDTEKHTFSFRFKFCIQYSCIDPETGSSSGNKYIYSDWSKVVSIGKNGNQKKLKTPTTITAPEISEPVKVIKDGKWEGFINYQMVFSQNVTDEERALIINEDAFQPIYLQLEAEINDSGNFIELYTANPNSLYNGTRLTNIDLDDFGGASKIKHICFRGYDKCNMLSLKSEYAYAVPQVKGVKAKKTTTKSITLTWTKFKDVEYYEIYDGNGKYLGKTSKNTNTFTVKKLKAGNDYTFKVRAVDNEIFVGQFSSTVKLPTKTAKVSVTKFSSPSAKKLTATWKKVSGDGYQVQIATDKKFTKIVEEITIADASELSATFSKAKSKTKYYVRVRGVNKAGKSTVYGAWSKVKSVKCK